MKCLNLSAALLLLLGLSLSGALDAQENVDVAILWDAATGDEIARIESDLPIWDAHINFDGSRLLVALQDGVLRMIDTETGETLSERRLEAERGGYNFPSFVDVVDPGTLIVAMSERFYVWDWAVDNILFSGDAPSGAIIPNLQASRVITMRREPPALVIYDAVNPDQPLVVALPARPIRASWSEDESKIALIYAGGMRVIDSISGKRLYAIEDDRFGDVYSEAVWSPDGKFLALQMTHSLDYEHTVVRVIDSASGATIQEFAAGYGIFSTEWSADGTRLLTAAYEGAGIRVFDVESGELVQQYGNLSVSYLSAGWNGDNTRIVAEAVVSSIDVIQVWDTGSGDNVLERVYPLGVQDLIWNAARSIVLLRRYPEMNVTVIDLANPSEVPVILEHDADLLGAAWSLDGTRIVTWTGLPRG